MEELYIKLTQEQIALGKEIVVRAKKRLEHNEWPDDFHMAAGLLRDVPLMKEAGLLRSAMLLESGEHGCSKNDVLGLIAHVETLLAGNWPVADDGQAFINFMSSCVLCGSEIDGHGNNAEPVKKGLCCDECNTTKVIPARMEGMVGK